MGLVALCFALGALGCTTGNSEPEPTANPEPSVASPLPAPTGSARTPTVPSTLRGTASSAAAGDGDGAGELPPADVSGATADGRGAPITVTDVTILADGNAGDGSGAGYDRVVLTIGGGGAPGWRVQYVQAALEQGSGRRVEVEGGAVLEVNLTNSGYPQDTGVSEYEGPDRVEGGETIREVVFSGVYEGITQIFLGVDERRPFRVFMLEDPARVVVDVVPDGG